MRAKKKKEGRRPKSEGERQSESDGDGLRARDKAPKEQLQELQRRCGPSPQAYFHTAQSPARHALTSTHTSLNLTKNLRRAKDRNEQNRRRP